MKIRIIKDCEIEIVDHYDEENDQPISFIEVFKIGEELEVDVFGFGGNRREGK